MDHWLRSCEDLAASMAMGVFTAQTPGQTHHYSIAGDGGGHCRLLPRRALESSGCMCRCADIPGIACMRRCSRIRQVGGLTVGSWIVSTGESPDRAGLQGWTVGSESPEGPVQTSPLPFSPVPHNGGLAGSTSGTISFSACDSFCDSRSLDKQPALWQQQGVSA